LGDYPFKDREPALKKYIDKIIVPHVSKSYYQWLMHGRIDWTVPGQRKPANGSIVVNSYGR